MDTNPLPYILSSVLCSSCAHVSLKLAAPRFGFDGAPGEVLLRLVGNGWLMAGIALHVTALVLWTLGLKRAELSYAYPFIALGFVLVALLSWSVFDEALSPTRLAGLALIVGGVLVVART